MDNTDWVTQIVKISNHAHPLECHYSNNKFYSFLPAYSDSPSGIIVSAGSVTAPQLSEGSFLCQLHDWRTITVCHIKSPQLKFSFGNIPSHLHSSEKDPVPIISI